MACGFLFVLFFFNNCYRTGTKLVQRVCGILKSCLNMVLRQSARAGVRTRRPPEVPSNFHHSLIL